MHPFYCTLFTFNFQKYNNYSARMYNNLKLKHNCMNGALLLYQFQAGCAKKEDCDADKFCSKFSYQCQQCVDGFGCFNDDQCCGKKVCKLGSCQVEPGGNIQIRVSTLQNYVTLCSFSSSLEGNM